MIVNVSFGSIKGLEKAKEQARAINENKTTLNKILFDKIQVCESWKGKDENESEYKLINTRPLITNIPILLIGLIVATCRGEFTECMQLIADQLRDNKNWKKNKKFRA